MTDSIQGSGLLYVRSRIAQSAKDLLDEITFLKWYDDEHITEVVSTSGIQSGFRYIDINKTSPCGDAANSKPFLAFYPMKDLRFTLGEEFRKIGFKSENLPGSGIVYDLADMDVSYLRFRAFTSSHIPRTGRAKFILACGLRPDASIASTKAHEVLIEQTSLISRNPGYVRTLTFSLQYARTSAQSRALKGLPTTDEPAPEPSTLLAIHELDGKPEEDVVQRVKEISASAEKEVGALEAEVFVWGLERMHGKGDRAKNEMSLVVWA
ncbi:hypothetical protein EK21DRAFT_102945 [Setomelanomma holmii]|uniref:Uncharacterized protein n=1 Tax=Setomelanomma holmii TaxID=210430 RepID=A0A9P4H3F5_9PLEO|nr:hypothetical protein EK21DRAFT_102945 [Setomelanomma holmii]